jgi:hypothetical protein
VAVTAAVTPKLDSSRAASNYAAKLVETSKLDAATVAAEMATAFQGLSGYTYGNSWIAYVNYSATKYPLRLPAKWGFASIRNKANAGYRMQDTAVNAFGKSPTLTAPATAYPCTAGTKGVVVVGDLLNNRSKWTTSATGTPRSSPAGAGCPAFRIVLGRGIHRVLHLQRCVVHAHV